MFAEFMFMCIFVMSVRHKTNKYRDMISEVEKNQKLVQVNDNLLYVDNSNCQRWIVTELIEGGFVAENKDLGEDLFYFSELQLGWSFTEKTKEENFLNYRFRYV